MTLFVLKEAKDHIIGKEKLGDTRAETKAKKAKTAPKRSTTINKAIEEGKNSFSLSTPPPPQKKSDLRCTVGVKKFERKIIYPM